MITKAAAFGKSGYISVLQLQEVCARSFTSTSSQSNTNEFDPKKDTWREIINRAQSLYFQAILIEAHQNKELAAKISGLSRSQFYKKLDEIKNGFFEQSE